MAFTNGCKGQYKVNTFTMILNLSVPMCVKVFLVKLIILIIFLDPNNRNHGLLWI